MKEITLEELGEFKNGVNFKSAQMGRGIPLINVKDITDSHRIDVNELARVEIEVNEDMYARKDDLFFVRSSVKLDGIALSAQVLPSELPSVHCGFVIRFRPTSPKLHTEFLLYLLKSHKYRETLKGLSGGAAIVNISQSSLKGLRIPLPPKQTQVRVAGILKAYDDLIENNRRRIELLEQSARLIYKEWFVHLRFPGHEHTTITITNGIPDGWRRQPLKDITTKIGSGATPRGGAASYKTEGITLIRSQHVYDYRFDEDGLAFIDDEQARKLDNVIVEPLDILLNITGASVARCCMVLDRLLPARVNQHVMIIRVDPNKCSPHYILSTINSYQEKQQLLAIARAGGATREALTKDTIQNTTFTIPPRSLRTEFDSLASNLFNQRQYLSQQIHELAKARDLLLPRLMNGEIAV